jgi:hypothetical protein
LEIFPASSQGLPKSNLNLSFFQQKFDGFLKSRNSIKFVSPAQAGIQLFDDVLTPAFAGMTIQGIFYEIIKFDSLFGISTWVFPTLFGSSFCKFHFPFRILWAGLDGPGFLGYK